MATNLGVDPAPQLADVGGLFWEHAPFLVRVGVARADVEDMVQEIFLVVHSRGRFDPTHAASARSYLTAFASKAAANYRRKARVRARAHGSTAPGEDAPDPRATHLQLQRRLEFQVVHDAIQQLRPKLREVLVLFEVEDQTAADISAALRIPEGTVHSRVFHARKQLKKLLAGSHP